MANGFGSLYVGASGLQTSQNGLNVLANNLANVNTDGYVRQQVLYADRNYNPLHEYASVGIQQYGLGVDIGDVIHARDIFLDQSYRSQSGRKAFYDASYDATLEVQTFLQEMDGADFKTAMADLYEAFAEYAKDPADSANQNLVVQKSELFLSRAQAVYDGLKEYQKTINTKIKNDVDRINEIGAAIKDLNIKIQRIEAAHVETASALRDERDKYLDELAGLANITYTEQYNGIVTVRLEGQMFISESRAYNMGLLYDNATGFQTPYWPHLSDMEKEEYYEVFNLDRVSATFNNDRGEIKALLLARGDRYADYLDIPDDMSSYEYEIGIGNSVMMNSQAEMDKLVHIIATSINDIFCKDTTVENSEEAADLMTDMAAAGVDYVTAKDVSGNEYRITADTRILDEKNASVGSDRELPPRELFTRTGAERYTEVFVEYPEGSGKNYSFYVYNEEDPTDESTCYTMHSLSVNHDLIEDQSLIPHRTQNGTLNDYIDYNLSAELQAVWSDSLFTINPNDGTPTTFQGFYTKFVGELATNSNIFWATSENMKSTVDSIDANRQQVIGVSSDEELTNMIKYQNAYNASSRYINVVNSMIDTLINSMR